MGEDLLILQLVQLQDVGHHVRQAAGAVRDAPGVLHALVLRQIRGLQERTVILHHRQGRFHFVGHIRNKVCPQGLHAGQLLSHAVEAVDDLHKMLIIAETAGARDPGREIPGDDAFGGLSDTFRRTFHGELAANGIKHREQNAQQDHVDKGQLGSRAQILPREHNAQRAHQRLGEKHDAAGHQERHHQEEHDVVVQPSQESLHCFSTAL